MAEQAPKDDFESGRIAAINARLKGKFGKMYGNAYNNSYNLFHYDPATNSLVSNRKQGELGYAQALAYIKKANAYQKEAEAGYYQNQIRSKALQNYNNYNVEDTIKGETDTYRRNLAQQVTQQQKQVQANANARGMLHSGQRQKQEGQVNQAANEDFAQKRNDIVQSTLANKQKLGLDPLTGMANQSLSGLQSKYNEVANQSNGSGLGDSAALIGSGIGTIAAGNGKSKVTPGSSTSAGTGTSGATNKFE